MSLLLTIEEAAKQLHIGRSLAYKLVAEGQLRSIKVGRLRRVPLTALALFVEQQMLLEESLA